MIEIDGRMVDVATVIVDKFLQDFKPQQALEMISVMNAHACMRCTKPGNEFGLLREHFIVSKQVLETMLKSGVKK